MALTEGELLEGSDDKSGMTLKRFILKQQFILGIIVTGLLFLVLGFVLGSTIGGILGAYGTVLVALGFLGYIVIGIVTYRLNN